MSVKRARENLVTVCVAGARGGTVEFETTDEWPDAWLVAADGERIPVEVVTAIERAPGESAKSGSAVVAKLAELQGEADRLTAEDGRGRLFGAYPDESGGADGWMVDFGPGGKGRWGRPMSLPDPARAILTAALQKMAKRYSEAEKTILVIDWGMTSIFQFQRPPAQWDLTSVGTQLVEHGCNFREVWAVIMDPTDPRVRAERLFPAPRVPEDHNLS